MTIGTAPLTPDVRWQELDALVGFLAALGVTEVAITYGWGCTPFGDERTPTIPLAQLIQLLQNNIAQGIYHLGEDNLFIGASNPAQKITLCHDADIHFDADPNLEARLRGEWEARGHCVWPTTKHNSR